MPLAEGKPAIFVDSISKSYGGFQALNKVSFAVSDGQLFGLLGPNGAGKSTITKIIAGLMRPDSGSVYFYGQELFSNYGEIKKFIAVVPQEVSFYSRFSVEQNLDFFGRLYGLKGKKLADRKEFLLRWLALQEFRKRPAEHLSGGYQRLLNIACSLVHDPRIILMDEPTVGLDPRVRQLFWDKIEYLKSLGKTIILTTHYMEEAQQLCSMIGFIEGGSLLTTGTPHELVRRFGGIKILIMQLSKPPDTELLGNIQKHFPASEINVAGNYIIISLTQQHSAEKIAVLTVDIINSGYEIVSSSVKEPTLEDVFLHLTGKRMGD